MYIWDIISGGTTLGDTDHIIILRVTITADFTAIGDGTDLITHTITDIIDQIMATITIIMYIIPIIIITVLTGIVPTATDTAQR